MNEQLLFLLIESVKHPPSSDDDFLTWTHQWKTLSDIPLMGVSFSHASGNITKIPQSFITPQSSGYKGDGWHDADEFLCFVHQHIEAYISCGSKMSKTEMEPWLLAYFIPLKYYLLVQENKHQHDALYMRNFILDHISEMIAIKDKQMIFRYANKAAEQGFKNDLDTIVNKSVKEVYPEHEVQHIVKLDKEVYQKDYPIKKTIKMLLSKTFIDAETERMIYKSEDGKSTGILSINRNVTDRILIEEQLKKSLELQSILIKISLEFINVAEYDVDKKLNEALKMVGEFIQADRVYVFEYDYHHYVTNNTYEWCYEGIEPMIDELQGVSITDVYDDWYYPHSQHKTIYINDVNSLDHHSTLYQILAPQDIQSILTIPLFEEDNLTGFVGFDAVRQIRDWSEADQKLLQILAELIVHLKRNQRRSEELIQSRILAEEANRAKSIFLANMSHELRTPLSGLFNAINLIEESVTDTQQMDYINIAKTSIESFSTIINDILDFTRIEQHKMVIDETYFNLENEIYQLAKMQEYAILEKNLEFIYHFDCKIHHLVKLDRLRLRQVILNLLNNAIKFTDHGTITLATHLVDENENYLTIQFDIIDTGVGMDSEMMERIFEPFEKGTNQQKRNFSGAGLGIPIVKGILDHYSSSLQITSAPNQGSTFSFIIDFEKGENLITNYQGLSNQKVLVITHHDLYQTMEECLKSIQLETHYHDMNTPVNFKQELNYLIYMPGDQPLDQPWLDHDFMQAKLKNIKIIVCMHKKTMIENTLLSQADYVVKYPMSRDKFYQTLIHASQKKIKKPINELKGLSVLVVDDHKINRQALEAMLVNRGCEVILAENGFQAIDVVTSTPIDIILMDIQMPGMDGYQTTKMIRDMNYTMDELPIIAISANRFEGSMEEALRLGLNGYIMKPFKMDTLIYEIDKAFQKSDAKPQDSLSGVKPFDLDNFLELFNHKLTIAYKIVDGFIKDYPKDIANIQHAYDQKDEALLRHYMHYFKGAAAYVTADRIVNILDRCSILVKEGHYQDVKPLIHSLDDEVHRWMKAIEKSLPDLIKHKEGEKP